MVETSPPTSGSVYDGPEENLYIDVDYITSSDTYAVHWTDFIDPHTTVKEYYISVGSCKECDDIITEQSVGVATGKIAYIFFCLPLFHCLKVIYLVHTLNINVHVLVFDLSLS